jgi:hypothetical protein
LGEVDITLFKSVDESAGKDGYKADNKNERNKTASQ